MMVRYAGVCAIRHEPRHFCFNVRQLLYEMPNTAVSHAFTAKPNYSTFWSGMDV